MINNLLDDVEKSFKSEAYMAGLSLLLILIDTCRKAEYKNNNDNKQHFIDWFDKYIGDYYKKFGEDVSLKYENEDIQTQIYEFNYNMRKNYINGAVIYGLRCNMLHQGTPNIMPPSDDEYAIDEFRIYIPKKENIEPGEDWSGLRTDSETTKRIYTLNLIRFKHEVCNAVKSYYEKNKKNFDFFNYTLLKENDFVFLKNK